MVKKIAKGNIRFMKRAISLAESNVKSCLGGPFGAVVVKDGEIIGEGVNTVTGDNDPTAHAEINAIRQASKNIRGFDLSGSSIYTSAEPCPMCLSAIYWARIDRIYFGNSKSQAAAIGFDDAYIYEQIMMPIGKRAIPSSQMLEDEARMAFQAWEKSEEKILY
jgi:tRNA(Arg) A34 adenosine deaminase TadA